MDKQILADTARAMVADGKGILAADESTPTIGKRFAAHGIESTENSRRDYREMLFRTETALRNYISGIILYDETIRQKATDGTPLIDIITAAGCLPGIKVDMGAKALAGHDNEKVTEGLDGLRERLRDYQALGARFAKWRAVITIADNLPSRACIMANAHALARYAALCQENNIVPIVEPEVLMDGAHDCQRCFEVTAYVLAAVYEQLAEQGVYLEGTVLKPNMIVSGTQHPEQAGIEQVAEMTLDCLSENVPSDVPGIVFLSGGQSDIDATAHLDTMNKIAMDKTAMSKANIDKGKIAWRLSFSYGRALQAAALASWQGKAENISTAQAVFAHRAKMNGLATQGQWQMSLEKEAEAKTAAATN